MRRVAVTPVLVNAVVFFILAAIIAHKGTDLAQGVALFCGLLGYVLSLAALMVHMSNKEFSR